MKRLATIRPFAVAAIGIVLGRGAQADTILDFNAVPAGQPNNGPPGVLQTHGDFAAASSDGVSVVGFGTPNIGLSWSAFGGAESRWDFYNDTGIFDVWSAGQLNDSAVGGGHSVTLAPNNPAARVVVKSFNFHPYYNSTERFTYRVSVLAGATVVSGPTNITFLSDATKNHPVSLNYTGALGQTLKLRINRVASTLGAGEEEGGAFNIAVDDIRFAQLPETVFPAGPQVVSVTPADDQTGVPAIYHPYLASVTNGETTLVASSIQLKLDGTLVSPAPIISSAGGLTNVSYPGTNLLSSGPHFYALTYNDHLGSNYTHEVHFTANYATLPAAFASPPGSGITRGFTHRTVAAPLDTTNTFANSIARAKAQLDGTLIDPSTGFPYTNSASVGTNADGSFSLDTVLNFADTQFSAGNFPDDQQFPGIDAGPINWFATESKLYLELPAGYYRFGVNSDDGFEMSVAPPAGVPGFLGLLGAFDNGRGASDTLFDVLAQVGGIYSFQLVYFEGDGSASCEFFSVTNLSTGGKLLVNDPADASAIKSYRVLLLRPHITSIVRDGPDVVIQWANGNPPFQVQTKSSLTNQVWTNSGSPTSNRTANVPIQPGNGFIRVVGQ